MYGEKVVINTFADLSAYVISGKCTWVFVNIHSNKVFGDINRQYDYLNDWLNEHMTMIDGVYEQGDNDFPGLYQSNSCKPKAID